MGVFKFVVKTCRNKSSPPVYTRLLRPAYLAVRGDDIIIGVLRFRKRQFGLIGGRRGFRLWRKGESVEEMNHWQLLGVRWRDGIIDSE